MRDMARLSGRLFYYDVIFIVGTSQDVAVDLAFPINTIGTRRENIGKETI